MKKIITENVINFIVKKCYHPVFLLCWEKQIIKREKLFKVTVNKIKTLNPSKNHNINCNCKSFITPMEHFTAFNVENPVHEIITYTFI